MQHSFYFDGSLKVGQLGQLKSSLYYAFSKSGGVLVGHGAYFSHADE
jgi:hypothetical protein